MSNLRRATEIFNLIANDMTPRFRRLLTICVLLAAVNGCSTTQVRDHFGWFDARIHSGLRKPGDGGQDVFTFSNGDQLRGTFRSGQIVGRATVQYADGKQYHGEFRNNRIHGYGTLILANGDRYEGRFINGRRHGQGIYQFATGGRYQGAFSNDEITGFGRFVYANGDRYTGYLVNGSHHGLGRMEFADGRAMLEGRWERGTFVWPQTLAF